MAKSKRKSKNKSQKEHNFEEKDKEEKDTSSEMQIEDDEIEDADKNAQTDSKDVSFSSQGSTSPEKSKGNVQKSEDTNRYNRQYTNSSRGRGRGGGRGRGWYFDQIIRSEPSVGMQPDIKEEIKKNNTDISHFNSSEEKEETQFEDVDSRQHSLRSPDRFRDNWEYKDKRSYSGGRRSVSPIKMSSHNKEGERKFQQRHSFNERTSYGHPRQNYNKDRNYGSTSSEKSEGNFQKSEDTNRYNLQYTNSSRGGGRGRCRVRYLDTYQIRSEPSVGMQPHTKEEIKENNTDSHFNSSEEKEETQFEDVDVTKITDKSLQKESNDVNVSRQHYERTNRRDDRADCRQNNWRSPDRYRDNCQYRDRRIYSGGRRSDPPIKISSHNKEAQQSHSFNESTSYGHPRQSYNKDRNDFVLDISKYREYCQYETELEETSCNIGYDKSKEIEQNLFTMPREYSLAHCVAEDMNMGSGIAVQFRRDFKRIPELLNQRQQTGGLAVLNDKERFIYYLVTKKHSWGKPTYKTLFSSLQELRRHVAANEVKKLAMPRIGCGLDRLQWEKVKCMIEFVFRDVDVEITICNLQQSEESGQTRYRNCKVVNVTYPIHTVEEQTVIVYLSSEDGFISKEMELLDEKFHFLHDFKMPELGEVMFNDRNKSYLLAGCIVKKTKGEAIDFKALQKCISTIRNVNHKKFGFSFVAFQAIEDEDTLVNYKIINILRNTFQDVEVYICWPGDLKNLMSPKDQLNTSMNTEDEGNTSLESKYFSSKDNISNTSCDDICGLNKSDNVKSKKTSRRNLSFESGDQNAQLEKDKDITNDEEPSNSDVSEDDEGQTSKKYKKSRSKGATQQETCSQNDNATSSLTKSSTKPSSQTNLEKPQNPPYQRDYEREYELYKAERRSGKIKFTVDLKESPNFPPRFSRVCYVTEDMCIESGTTFGDEFRRYLANNMNEEYKEGSCIVIKVGQDHLFCLIVKKLLSSPFKPLTVFKASQELKVCVKRHRVTKLAVPSITGDDFDNDEIKNMYEFVFRESQIQIVMVKNTTNVSYYDSIKNTMKNGLKHVKSPIFHAKKSMLIFWASEGQEFSKEMDQLNRKLDFKKEYTASKRSIGDVFRYKENEECVVYGCIVKKTLDSKIDFLKMEKCLSLINEMNKKNENLPNAAVQAMQNEDDIVNYNIVNMLLNNLENVAISYCWPGVLKERMPPKNP